MTDTTTNTDALAYTYPASDAVPPPSFHRTDARSYESVWADRAEYHRKVTQLVREKEAVEVRLNEVNNRDTEAIAKFRELGEFMKQTADDNSMCEKYDEAVAEWNGNEGYRYQLPERVETFEFSYTVNVTVEDTTAGEDDIAEAISTALDSDDIDSTIMGEVSLGDSACVSVSVH